MVAHASTRKGTYPPDLRNRSTTPSTYNWIHRRTRRGSGTSAATVTPHFTDSSSDGSTWTPPQHSCIRSKRCGSRRCESRSSVDSGRAGIAPDAPLARTTAQGRRRDIEARSVRHVEAGTVDPSRSREEARSGRSADMGEEARTGGTLLVGPVRSPVPRRERLCVCRCACSTPATCHVRSVAAIASRASVWSLDLLWPTRPCDFPIGFPADDEADGVVRRAGRRGGVR